jgi:hypothetical protein
MIEGSWVAHSIWQALIMRSGAELIETEARRRLPYQGMQVIHIKVSYQLTLVLDGGAEIDLETDGLLTQSAQGLRTRRPFFWSPYSRIRCHDALLGCFQTGSLRLVFSTGAHLNVKPHREYERPRACSSSVNLAVAWRFGHDREAGR